MRRFTSIYNFGLSTPKEVKINPIYNADMQASIDSPQLFWLDKAKYVTWKKFPTIPLQTEKDYFFKWFPDGLINITQNCLDRHMIDIPNQVAYHIESPITNTRSQITYQQLLVRVQKFASMLKNEFGLKPHDRAIIYMPMIIQSIIAKLACARIGVIHSVVFGGFAAHQLAIRVKDCDASVIICSNSGKEPNRAIDYLQIVQNALRQASKEQIKKIIFFRKNILPQQNPHSNWKSFKQLSNWKNAYNFQEVQKAGGKQTPIYVPSNSPLYILYTSGTTGTPKGVVRDHGGTATILQHTLYNIYGLKKGDGLFSSSDIGWVVGHSYITYAPLIGGLRSVLFEGKPVKTPDPGVYWDVISRHKIKHLYTSPTAIRSIRKEDSQGKFIKKYDLSSLQGITVAGQRCDISTGKWLLQHFKGKQFNQSYWQTQSGAPILTNFAGVTYQSNPPKPGSSCKRFPGWNLKVLDPQTGQQCGVNKTGILMVGLPLPPSFMLTMWNNDAAYIEKYFSTIKGYYTTGDSGFVDQDGDYHVMSRIDDVINTAGHRLSTGQMQETLLMHNLLAQAIVVGVDDQIKGQVPVGFVTLKTNNQAGKINKKMIEKDLVQLVRDKIGPVASFKTCLIVDRLPKTRSGKYLRNIVKKMCNKQPFKVPSTVEDVQCVHYLQNFINQWHEKSIRS